MAVGAHRGLFDAVGAGAAVNAFFVDREDVLVTAAASRGDVGPIHPAGGIGRTVEIVCAMAVGTNGGVYFPRGEGQAVDRVVVGVDGSALGQPLVGRGVGLSVAGGAGVMDVFAVDGRGRVP